MDLGHETCSGSVSFHTNITWPHSLHRRRKQSLTSELRSRVDHTHLIKCKWITLHPLLVPHLIWLVTHLPVASWACAGWFLSPIVLIKLHLLGRETSIFPLFKGMYRMHTSGTNAFNKVVPFIFDPLSHPSVFRPVDVNCHHVKDKSFSGILKSTIVLKLEFNPQVLMTPGCSAELVWQSSCSGQVGADSTQLQRGTHHVRLLMSTYTHSKLTFRNANYTARIRKQTVTWLMILLMEGSALNQQWCWTPDPQRSPVRVWWLFLKKGRWRNQSWKNLIINNLSVIMFFTLWGEKQRFPKAAWLRSELFCNPTISADSCAFKAATGKQASATWLWLIEHCHILKPHWKYFTLQRKGLASAFEKGVIFEEQVMEKSILNMNCDI